MQWKRSRRLKTVWPILFAGTLIEQLRNATYECMVCCENIRCEAAVWSCSNCYNVFHLRCVKKWAKSPAAVVENRDGNYFLILILCLWKERKDAFMAVIALPISENCPMGHANVSSFVQLPPEKNFARLCCPLATQHSQFFSKPSEENVVPTMN